MRKEIIESESVRSESMKTGLMKSDSMRTNSIRMEGMGFDGNGELGSVKSRMRDWKLRKVVRGAASVVMAVAMCVASLYVPGGNKSAEAAEGKVYVKATDKRQQINFNRNWKFIRQDAEGAQAASYDDSGWVDVGLPHNFSIPYNMETDYYAGYGWYRKSFDVPADWNGKRISIEFEGVFQVAEVYVNGEIAGTHEGGYTGFEYDITDYIHAGANEVAVRVNNIWQHDLAPRGGDHTYTGGIYRDVYLNVTDDVHVTWYGTFVTTPDLTNPGWDESAENIDFSVYPTEDEVQANIDARQSNVAVRTEVKNDSAEARNVNVTQTVVNADDKIVAQFGSETKSLAAGEVSDFEAVSAQLKNIELWSPDNPYMYKVYTTVYSNGAATDTYESPLGFRWVQWLVDGFYLNGEKTFIYGANAHQDHGGWCDAVSDAGLRSDIEMLKEAGMNLIRGSHYPHDPSYTVACDEIGMMFWSENCFWAYGGGGGKDADPVGNASDWMKDPYPQSAEYEEAFEQGCMDSLRDMIRINRNHPSVVNWSMGNEVFFTGYKTQDKCKALVNKMRNYSHELDPTRKAAMGGVQRNDYDTISICDIAGYNGDGATLCDNRVMPNIVSEYGSKTADRPGEFRPYYGDCQTKGDVNNYSIYPTSAGIVLWCAFHHGSIGGSSLERMGCIDYYRLPLQSWYWYRENMGTGEAREASIKGEAEQMSITTSTEYLTNDGKKDAHLIVTLEDGSGTWVNDTRNVTLSVKSGPGIFPGGKNYTFIAGDTIRDGKAAIEFRSYYSGDTVITASAEGLPDAEITLHTTDVTGDERDTEPENFYNAKRWATATSRVNEPYAYGADNLITNHPLFPSSGQQTRVNAADGNATTAWIADVAGSGQYMMVDLEIAQNIYKAKLEFNNKAYPYSIEVSMDGESWTPAAAQTADTLSGRVSEETINGLPARYVKVTFNNVSDTEFASLAELSLYGNVNSQAPQYESDGKLLEDITAASGEEQIISLGGKYSLLEGKVSLGASGTGEAGVKLYADEALVFDSSLTTGNIENLNFSVSGVKELKLVNTAVTGSLSVVLSQMKVYGALRDISRNQNTRLLYRSLDSMLRAGTTYTGSLSIRGANAIARGARGIMGLYDGSGTLTDLVTMNAENDFVMDLPSDISGYEARIRVFDSSTMGMLSKTTAITRDSGKLTSASGNGKPAQSAVNPEKLMLLASIDRMLTAIESKDYSVIDAQSAATAATALAKACEIYQSVNASAGEISQAAAGTDSAVILLDAAYARTVEQAVTPVIGDGGTNPGNVKTSDSAQLIPAACSGQVTATGIPQQVTGLKQKKQTVSSISLTWTKADGATSYKVERYIPKTKSWKLIKSTLNNLHIDKKLKPTTIYKYRVSAVNSHGTGAASAVYKAATCPKQMNFKASKSSKGILVSWNKSAASGVSVYIKAGNSKFIKVADVKAGKNGYIAKRKLLVKSAVLAKKAGINKSGLKSKKITVKLVPYCKVSSGRQAAGKATQKSAK